MTNRTQRIAKIREVEGMGCFFMEEMGNKGIRV
jgi:hypothetical protein